MHVTRFNLRKCHLVVLFVQYPDVYIVFSVFVRLEKTQKKDLLPKNMRSNGTGIFFLIFDRRRAYGGDVQLKKFSRFPF